MARRWYFVLHLGDDDVSETRLRYEVQVLDESGRASEVGRFSQDELTLVVDGVTIPEPVLAAALRQTKGKGDYVGDDGQSVAPF